MGVFNNNKEQWTKEGIKSSLKERWIDILAIAIASGPTPSLIRWLGWTENSWIYIVVFFFIAIVVGILAGVALSIIKKIKK